MCNRLIFGKLLYLIICLILFGCAGNSNVEERSKVVQPTIEDQKIIDSGVKRAKELGLRPFPMVGDGRGGKFTVISPAIITYNRQGNWEITSEDLYINATQGDITLKNLTIKRGQYARQINYKLEIVE